LGDYLISKRLTSRGLPHTASLSGTSTLGTLAWSIQERFNLQIELGSGNFNWNWQQAGNHLSGQSYGGLLWEGDAKLVLFEAKDTLFALDGQVGGWSWMEGPITSNGTALTQFSHSLLRFWQVSAALSQRISWLTPYLGMAVNHTRMKISQLATESVWLNARHILGPFGGCTISNGSLFLVNWEWRGWFEEGVSLSAQIRF